MQRKKITPIVQWVFSNCRYAPFTPYRLPASADSCRDGGPHRWGFLMPGFQLCTKCGRIRKKPANGGE